MSMNSYFISVIFYFVLDSNIPIVFALLLEKVIAAVSSLALVLNVCVTINRNLGVLLNLINDYEIGSIFRLNVFGPHNGDPAFSHVFLFFRCPVIIVCLLKSFQCAQFYMYAT